MKKYLIPFLVLQALIGYAESPLAQYPRYQKYVLSQAPSVQEHYDTMLSQIDEKKHRQALSQALAIIENYPNSAFAAEACYFQGVIFFDKGEYERANHWFSAYLNNFTQLKYFFEAIEYKFKIAEAYSGGVKKHLLGAKKLPKWVSAKDDAIELYEEVITSLPRHDICAKALYMKGQLLFEYDEYKESIDTFQTLIRRFPQHELAAQAFTQVAAVYLKQSRTLFPDPDFIELAEINLAAFKRSFPVDPKVKEAQAMLLDMKEVFAKELIKIGKYFHKKKKYEAAQIYYKTLLHNYPETKSALIAQQQMGKIDAKISKK